MMMFGKERCTPPQHATSTAACVLHGAAYRAAHHLWLESLLEGQHHTAQQRIAPQTHERDEQVWSVHIHRRRPVSLTSRNLQLAQCQAQAQWQWSLTTIRPHVLPVDS